MNISKNSLSRDKLTYENKIIKNIHYGDIHKKFGDILNSSNNHIPYILDEEFKTSSNSILNDGDIIFTDAAEDMTVGKCVELDLSDNDKVVAGLHTIPARPNRSGKYFYGYYLNSDKYHNKLIPLIEGTKVSSISKSKLNSTNVIYPEIEEQTRIGALFKNIDKLIEIQNQKVENLKSFKKSMLQKMFPKDGEKVPEIRFSGFSGDWEELTFKDIYGNVKSGNRLPKSDLIDGDIPYIIAKVTDNGIHSRISADTKDYHGNSMKLFKENSITFSIDNPDAIFIQNEPFFTSNIMRIFYNENHNTFHTQFFYEQFKKRTKGYDWGIKFSGPVALESKLMVPIEDGEINYNEVQKVGQFFKNLDSNISHEESLLASYKNLKKSLLQKMFI